MPDDHSHHHAHDHPSATEHINWNHGGLRAVVFGMSDGLVSTAALVVGVAGGTSNGDLVLLAGVSGLLAGACSMAAGEWVSVTSQKEALTRQLELERDHLQLFPGDERQHMVAILKGAGLSDATSLKVAEELESDPDANLDFHAKIELGIDPADLGAPGLAALASFLAFTLGGLMAVVPWMVSSGAIAMWATIFFSGIGLFALGVALSWFTLRSWWWSGLRQLALGAGAAEITYLIGGMVGV